MKLSRHLICAKIRTFEIERGAKSGKNEKYHFGQELNFASQSLDEALAFQGLELRYAPLQMSPLREEQSLQGLAPSVQIRHDANSNYEAHEAENEQCQNLVDLIPVRERWKSVSEKRKNNGVTKGTRTRWSLFPRGKW